jgi:hypothetical protein
MVGMWLYSIGCARRRRVGVFVPNDLTDYGQMLDAMLGVEERYARPDVPSSPVPDDPPFASGGLRAPMSAAKLSCRVRRLTSAVCGCSGLSRATAGGRPRSASAAVTSSVP